MPIIVVIPIILFIATRSLHFDCFLELINRALQQPGRNIGIEQLEFATF